MKSGTAKSVLIIEENDAYRALLRKILNNLNCYVVGESSGGSDALKIFERKKPGVVLLDIILPQKYGLEILKKIIEREPTQVVIMMTSESEQGIVQSCISAGARGYILKTGSANEIRDRISKFIG